ncbi:PxKF domain-containing protein [Cryobacterium sp. Sr8]|uniref:OmpL47-type beta-barrel domain-containing protein n=1 Tax=Cryobacterium sp. Sr8 TaxID=1259203 RepID=UPI001068DE0D|nr:PxKF domain-containing protein [Cryobacterium sp. Sr8]
MQVSGGSPIRARFFSGGRTRARLAVIATLALVLGLLGAPPAFASTANSAVFSGSTGTVSVGGVLYARQGGALTLTVTTSSDTKCVEVVGAFAAGDVSATGKTSWTFTTTAGAGNGSQTVTAAASPNVNAQGKCTGPSSSAQGSYTLDNTGPTVTGTLAPAPNAAGWNKANVGITWSASDAGSGMSSAPTPSTDSVNANTAVTGTVKTATAADRLGNAGNGSVTVKLDKTQPSIDANRSPAANGAGWNNTNVTVGFTCADTLSGIKSCTGGGSVVLSAEGANQSVPGTAVDNADNTNTSGVTGINIDKTAPSLTGAPTTQPNVAGWYRGDVSIDWTATDALSGIAGAAPASGTISGEGTGLTVGASVGDLAGNTRNATSPAVRIDRTPPTTGISGTSNIWTNGNVTVSFSPGDNLSGVASTSYAVDGGPAQSGTGFTLAAEGDHIVTFHSTDLAGNVEETRTAHVKIDKTAPTIGHTFAPVGYSDGAWTNADVTVTFLCTDSGSGIAGCTAPATLRIEGASQQVVGTATDNAGNSAGNTAVVSIDKTPPTVTAGADRAPNGAAWYRDDVTVSFEAADALSGIASSPAATVLGEGENQSASGTATDAAGNSASAELTGINVDKTAPVLTASFPAGWHTADVAVDWTCTDALSGVATPPTDDVVDGEGNDLGSTRSCTDVAGNTATKTVSGITIDRTAPTTGASVPAPLASGWYADDVTVTLSAQDALSGIDVTYYSVDGGDAQAYVGSFLFTTRGTHSIAFWSIDVAGNLEARIGNEITVKIDGAPPITTVINPISPASGWFVTSGIPVAFDATDVESGIAATYYSIDDGPTLTYGQPFETQLAVGSHSITYWSVDLAGNAETARSTTVWVDTVRPTITGEASPAANGFGWNNTAVDVTFSCTDAVSGIDPDVACGPDVSLGAEGAEQLAAGVTADIAGNTNSATVGPIRIDKTPPTLSGAATTTANGAGWYRGDVTIDWTGADLLSGIEDQAADSVITGEGADLGASAIVSDRAGNEASATVSGVKIDRTAPVIEGQATTEPNAAGWYRGQVTVDFSCSDLLSGVAVCPTSELVSGNGPHQSATSGPATDQAGNDNPGLTVGDINIDGIAPSTTADNQCSAVNGWCKGQTATVVLSADDQPGLSGVREIHYSIGGAAAQVASGSTASVTVPLNGSGSGTVSYWAVDNAGNAEAANTVDLKWDNIAPTVSHTLSPVPNPSAWNRSDVTVTFEATDDDPGSGVASVTAPVTVDAETPLAGLLVSGSAEDTAGNVGTDAVTVRLDKTAPRIIGGIASGTAGANGWYLGPVSVHFDCSDALSGVASCPDDVTVTDNGTNTVDGTATDMAGNTADDTVGGIRIDQEVPSTSASVSGTHNNGWYTGLASVTLSGTDTVSGLDTTFYSLDGQDAAEYTAPLSVGSQGTHTVTFWSTDLAGNVESVNTLTFQVDRVAPVTTVINPDAPASGWFLTGAVPVELSATDSGSGVAGTYFTIDDGPAVTYGQPLLTDLASGSHTITYWSLDQAGNVEAKRELSVDVDAVKPTIAGAASPGANGFGWNNTSVDVTFTCADADSGLAGCGPNSTVANEGAGQLVSGTTADVAGNTNSATVGPISVDKTAPTLSGTPTTGPNAAGWYRGDVTIGWTGVDGLSGIAHQAADSLITGEGADLSSSADVADRAGNEKHAMVTGIRIDRTAPVLEGRATTQPNAAGWYQGQVTVGYACTDTLSGMALCPTSRVVSGNGANQSVTSDPATDNAGNESAVLTVGGINVDGAAPSTTADNQCSKINEYCTGEYATVVLSAADQAGLSGVREIHYTVDGGDPQVAPGASVTLSVPLAGSGTGTVSYFAVDNAGNREASSGVALKWDNIAPTVSHLLSPLPNGNDWNKSDVTVTFSARDDDAGSGLVTGSVTAPVTVGTETLVTGLTIQGQATDTAGNIGRDSATVKLDKTAPTIAAAIVRGSQGTNGWYTGPVTVRFTCADALSGIAVCPADVTLTDNGTNTVTRDVADNAGNTAEATLSGIRIDSAAPTITNVSVAGGFYLLGAAPAATCTATDDVSGLAGTCTVTVAGGRPNGVGTFIWTATATDAAGNTVTTTGSYQVIYRFDGFLQPINDTAHQVGLTTSVFKGGSTIPVKFQLKKADGTPVLSSTAPAWLMPVKGAVMSMPIDETVYAITADSGMSFRADGTQYIYNWKTPAGGNYYGIGVRLDDGQVYYVSIGLRK